MVARTHPPYAPEFRRQMAELVRAGREPVSLSPLPRRSRIGWPLRTGRKADAARNLLGPGR